MTITGYLYYLWITSFDHNQFTSSTIPILAGVLSNSYLHFFSLPQLLLLLSPFFSKHHHKAHPPLFHKPLLIWKDTSFYSHHPLSQPCRTLKQTNRCSFLPQTLKTPAPNLASDWLMLFLENRYDFDKILSRKKIVDKSEGKTVHFLLEYYFWYWKSQNCKHFYILKYSLVSDCQGSRYTYSV